MDNSVEEKLVYEAFKGLLTGENSNIRFSKDVKSLIKAHATSPNIAALLKSQKQNGLNQTVRRLIEDGIFGSESKAFERFYGSVPDSTASNQQTNSPPENSSPSLPGSNCFGNTSTDSVLPIIPGLTYKSDIQQACAPTEISLLPCPTTDYKTHQTSIVPTGVEDGAEPTSLPFSAQYHLLEQLQKCLEMACFDFACEKLPIILKENNWGCWEAAELNSFVRELAKQPGKLPGLNEVTAILSIAKLVGSMTELRHSAVYRHYLTSSHIEEFLQRSEYFLALIADNKRREVVNSLRLTVLDCLAELDDHEHEATQSIRDVRERMEAKRLELKRQEEAEILKLETMRTKFREAMALKVSNAIKLSFGDDPTEGRIAFMPHGITQIIFAFASGIWLVTLLVTRPIVAAAAATLLRIGSSKELRGGQSTK